MLKLQFFSEFHSTHILAKNYAWVLEWFRTIIINELNPLNSWVLTYWELNLLILQMASAPWTLMSTELWNAHCLKGNILTIDLFTYLFYQEGSLF